MVSLESAFDVPASPTLTTLTVCLAIAGTSMTRRCAVESRIFSCGETEQRQGQG